MASAARNQQRLWSDEDPEPKSDGAADKPKWRLDSDTKRVGRAGLAAARERIRRTRKATSRLK